LCRPGGRSRIAGEPPFPPPGSRTRPKPSALPAPSPTSALAIVARPLSFTSETAATTRPPPTPS
jgi:hypothetical protein